MSYRPEIVKCLIVLFTVIASSIVQASLKTDNFVLIDHNGKAQELYYQSDAAAVVIIAQSKACKSMQLTDFRELQSKFSAKQVRFFMINSEDPREDIRAAAAEMKLSMPILHDSAKIIGPSLNIKTAGEVLVINPQDWQVVYRGSSSDSGLQAQLASLVAGDAVVYQENKAEGCDIDYAAAPEIANYSDDIAPILEKNCKSCHVKGGIGPWAMSEYRMVQGFAPMMREVIRVKRMPPWHADPAVGHWKNDAGMSDADTRTLIHWLEAGAPRGEGADPLLASNGTDKFEWPLGEPDLILELPAFTVAATGEVDYQYPVIANPLDHDVWVEAATILPGDTQVVHHVLLGSAEKAPEKARAGNVFQNYIMGYAPGNESAHMPEGTGVFVPVGGVYQLQLHYTPIGTERTDITKVALYFADKKPGNFLRQQAILNPRLKIPAHAEAHEESAYFEFWDDAIVYSFVPHSHYRGKSSTFELLYPDGSKELILSVPNYSFDWQRTYNFETPKHVPKGTLMVHKTLYDNSVKNPSNPDPERTVPWGLQSHDEMLYGSVSYSWVNETSDKPTHTYLKADAAQFLGFSDRDLDGMLSKAELPKRMRERLGWFKWWFVDTNFDGGLDLDEIVAMFER